MKDDHPVVVVKNLYKSFRLPNEQHSGLKQLILSVFKGGRRGFTQQKVLEDISFEINEGEFFAIVGRNGSGKSTLLKLLAGIYAPNEGLVQLKGSLTPFIELGVGFNPELTGRENVYMNGALLGFSHREMDAMYDDIVSFAELKKFMDQKLKNYSSGMQVRLAFSIAIRARSDILLIDEVLAVGDAAFQQKCFDYFNQLRHEKRTIILVTHDMSAVKRFCTRAVYIKKGKVARLGSPTEIADMYLVDNIEELLKSQGSNVKAVDYKLDVSVKSDSESKFEIEFSYSAPNKNDMYIGISIEKNGQSIAEISTDIEKPLVKKGKVSYTVDKKKFNPGVYEVSAVLCGVENRNLLNIGSKRVDFSVKGNDIRRGSSMKLDDTWSNIR